MKLTKTVPFGKAQARITVAIEENIIEEIPFVRVGGVEVVESTKIEIIAPNGNVVETDNHASATNNKEVFSDRFKGFDSEYISMVGNATTAGREVADNINKTIEELFAEIKKEDEENEEVEIAERIVESVEDEEELMTEEEIKAWKKNYNDLVNEGGEGYIPPKISKEEYRKAKAIIKNKKGDV